MPEVLELEAVVWICAECQAGRTKPEKRLPRGCNKITQIRPSFRRLRRAKSVLNSVHPGTAARLLSETSET